MENIPKIVMGLYKSIRNGYFNSEKYKKILDEVKSFLKFNNRIIKDKLNKYFIFLAGDTESSNYLKYFGLKIEKIFKDAPYKIQYNKAHLMKHYMIIWVLEKI